MTAKEELVKVASYGADKRGSSERHDATHPLVADILVDGVHCIYFYSQQDGQ